MAEPRYVQGDIRPRECTIATAKTINKGDLAGLSSNTIVKPSDIAWDTNLATTQTAFVNTFVGVSNQWKTDSTKARIFGNSADNVLIVAAGGVWEFDCASTTFEVGDLVGPAKDTGNALLNDRVVAVGSEALAIGRVAKRGTSITRVQVELLPKLTPAARQS